MRVNFYSVEVPDGIEFVDILNAARKLPDDESRVRTISGTPYRLQRLARSARLWEGELIKIRMNEVPVIASLDGDTKPVDLEDDEGIGEETAFLYDTKTKVLLLQGSGHGVSVQRVRSYFDEIGQVDGAITFAMVLQPRAIQALSRFRVVRRLHVRLASVQNPQLLLGARPTTKDAIQLIAGGNAPVVEITIGMGHKRGTLAQSVIDSAKQFFGWRKDGPVDVEQIKVKGNVEDGSMTEIDLLEYRMREDINVQSDSSRRLPYPDRHDALREAWSRRKGELESIYPGN